MSRPLYKATVKVDGRKIQVYKLESGGYCNFDGCAETFKTEEIILDKRVPQ